jgi:rubredoxin
MLLAASVTRRPLTNLVSAYSTPWLAKAKPWRIEIMENSRWACPKCGSKDVEIALPLWCREDTSYDLSPGHLDEEADPIYWLCNTCEASDKGSPVDLLRN